jgi:hypothetical protein
VLALLRLGQRNRAADFLDKSLDRQPKHLKTGYVIVIRPIAVWPSPLNRLSRSFGRGVDGSPGEAF